MTTPAIPIKELLPHCWRQALKRHLFSVRDMQAQFAHP